MLQALNDFSFLLMDMIALRLLFLMFGPEGTPAKSNKWMVYISLLFQTLITMIIYEPLVDYFPLQQALIFVWLFLAMYFYKKYSLLRTFMLVAASRILFFMEEFLHLNIIFRILERGQAFTEGEMLQYRLVYLLIKSSVALLLAVMLLVQRDRAALTVPEGMRFTLVPVFTLVGVGILTAVFSRVESELQADAIYGIAFGFVLINVYVYDLFSDVLLRKEEAEEQRQVVLNARDRMKSYRVMEEHLNRQRSYAHEFRNRLMCIRMYLDKKEYDRLDEYLVELTGTAEYNEAIFGTGNAVADTILNQKYYEFLEREIMFIPVLGNLSELFIQDDDLVVLLSNLMENALEACDVLLQSRAFGEERPDPYVKLKMKMEEGHFILSVRNSCIGDAVEDEEGFATTKTLEPERHGLGIKNIIRVVEKYQGSYVIEPGEEDFYFSIYIEETPS